MRYLSYDCYQQNNIEQTTYPIRRKGGLMHRHFKTLQNLGLKFANAISGSVASKNLWCKVISIWRTHICDSNYLTSIRQYHSIPSKFGKYISIHPFYI